MTNYNDGKWHGWNGGECPVHPEAVVEVQISDERLKGYGRTWDWRHREVDDIIAFRVIKEHKEPREFWAVEWKGIDARSGEQTSSGWEQCSKDEDGAILFREVIE